MCGSTDLLFKFPLLVLTVMAEASQSKNEGWGRCEGWRGLGDRSDPESCLRVKAWELGR